MPRIMGFLSWGGPELDCPGDLRVAQVGCRRKGAGRLLRPAMSTSNRRSFRFATRIVRMTVALRNRHPVTVSGTQGPSLRSG